MSMLGLFEHDAKNLWSFAANMRDSVKRLIDAQAEMAAATQNISQVLGSFQKRVGKIVLLIIYTLLITLFVNCYCTDTVLCNYEIVRLRSFRINFVSLT